MRSSADGYLPGGLVGPLIALAQAFRLDRNLPRGGEVAPAPDYPLDGVDLVPVLTGRAAEFERTLYWRMRLPLPADGTARWLEIPEGRR